MTVMLFIATGSGTYLKILSYLYHWKEQILSFHVMHTIRTQPTHKKFCSNEWGRNVQTEKNAFETQVCLLQNTLVTTNIFL